MRPTLVEHRTLHHAQHQPQARADFVCLGFDSHIISTIHEFGIYPALQAPDLVARAFYTTRRCSY